jgi:RNA polymerase sigma factor (sigma-70 family)
MSDLRTLTDEELMKAYQQANEMAFTILYERYSGKLYGFLQGKLHDPNSVDDVFQGVFVKLHQTRASYDPAFPFAPWLFTVCRSVLVDHVRKKARSQEDLNPVAIEQAIALQATTDTPGLPNLDALPAAQRKAVELRYGSELSFDEIARKLDTSSSNVRQLVSRALKKLRGGK